MISALLKLIASLAALIWLQGCAGLPVRGSVGGQTIETRVDSEVAHYYLASYLAGKNSDPLLDQRINRVYQNSHDGLPDRGELKRLSDELSLDFAALYLADRIYRAPANQQFRAAFDEARAYTRNALPEGRVKLPATATDYEWVFVPTYLYKRYPITGSNFAAPLSALKRAGLFCHFVETVEDGAIEANAQLLADIIRARARTGRRLILLSASKSGPEVALALTRLGRDETRHVAAWVNIVGALRGTPLADKRLLPDIEAKTGTVDPAGADSLTTERSHQRFNSFRIPEHVLVVNYIGIPLTGSLSSWSRPGFSYLRNFGPNDGFLLLSDTIFPGAITVAELGRDHFLLDERIDATTVALAITVIRWLENSEPKSLKANVLKSESSSNSGDGIAR